MSFTLPRYSQLSQAAGSAFLRRCSRPTLGSPKVSSAALSTTSCRHDEATRPAPAQANSLTDIGIREIFNSDHDILRASVRKFFEDEIVPHHDQWEREGIMPKEMFKKAGAAGLLCPDVPEKFGGPGGNFLDLTIIAEEQTYANCSAPGFGVVSALVAPYLMKYGSEQAKQTFLPQLCAGDLVACLAMTEPGAGSDLQGMRTNARRDGDDWIINGSKIFISNGIISDIAIVACITNPEAKSKAHGMGLFILDANSPGFKKGRNLRKLGLKGQDTGELFFEDVRVPSWCALGDPDKGFFMLMDNLPTERIGIAISFIAAAEAMFEWTRTYIKERKAFGKPIANLQVIRHKMADMKIEICAARAFVDHCLELYMKDQLTSSTASMAKVLVTDLANKVAYDCVQLHGGYGFMEEYPISRAYRDVRIGPIYGGTNEIMKELIARDITA